MHTIVIFEQLNKKITKLIEKNEFKLMKTEQIFCCINLLQAQKL